MSDVADGYRALEEFRKERGREKTQAALREFDEAKRLAFSRGLSLKKCNESHYQLRCQNKWLINLFPGNGRIYADKKVGKAPFLEFEEDWTLLSAVKAAADAIGHA